jgi:hypothetical protein
MYSFPELQSGKYDVRIIPYFFENLNRKHSTYHGVCVVLQYEKKVDFDLGFRIMGKNTRKQLNISRYTIILNHPRGWGGKPQGSHADSRVAEISSLIFGPGFFIFR